MRRILAVLLVVALIGVVAVPVADAGGRHGHHGGGAVIGLAAFALFAPLIIAGEVLAHTIPYRAPAVVVSPPPVYYPPAPVYNAPAYATQPSRGFSSARAAAPPMTRVVQYAHGRYLLRGDGVYTAYQWVWIPNPPPPPPAPR